MPATVTAVRWKYSQKSDQSYPIKIRVTYKTESKYYPVEYKASSLSLSEQNWELIQADPTIKGELKRIRDHIRKCEIEARDVCGEVSLNGKRPFSFTRFDELYHKGSKAKSFLDIFDDYLQCLLNRTHTLTTGY